MIDALSIALSKPTLGKNLTFPAISHEHLDKQIETIPKFSPKVALFIPIGLLDNESFSLSKQKSLEIIATQPDILIIDMTRVRHMNSRGLGLLISLLRSMKNSNGRLILFSLSYQVKLHIQLSGVENLLEIHDQYPLEFIIHNEINREINSDQI